ncbi:MAG: hypothetical protein QOJ52_3507 [Acidimicrobiaceae bacterium]|jgi:hypothetical protein|nr:hypothetical protein [Acidimicrobiaceae bacterium]MDQ1366820.1 hypothetical protein [Acidimicrobiaceae bacterium]MDQ1376226.1 hypothetical protein [Acidimicrobiaceae bacterium]MDQ1399020.1 hypothetical protein [Acidimicrobiaceae bacterium]MDQ1414039.1 hypothetical protein [Acidimicrobiaceae bacterium]
MDEDATVKQDTERLDDLEGEIKEARHHLNERTHLEEDEPEFFEDDQEGPEEEAPGNDNVPA